MEQLERDKRERVKTSKTAGGDYEPSKNPAETIEESVKTIKKLYSVVRVPGVANDCLKICHALIKNLISDQSNEKYKKINLDNKAI